MRGGPRAARGLGVGSWVLRARARLSGSGGGGGGAEGGAWAGPVQPFYWPDLGADIALVRRARFRKVCAYLMHPLTALGAPTALCVRACVRAGAVS